MSAFELANTNPTLASEMRFHAFYDLMHNSFVREKIVKLYFDDPKATEKEFVRKRLCF
jgi:hypothetical protein